MPQVVRGLVLSLSREWEPLGGRGTLKCFWSEVQRERLCGKGCAYFPFSGGV